MECTEVPLSMAMHSACSKYATTDFTLCCFIINRSRINQMSENILLINALDYVPVCRRILRTLVAVEAPVVPGRSDISRRLQRPVRCFITV